MTKPVTLIAFAFAAAIACTAVATTAVAAGKKAEKHATDEVGDKERGRQLFIANGCFACHGYDGQGGAYTAPRIAPDPLPWQAIAAFIRNPPNLKAPYLNWPFNVMPPFTSKMVSDQDVQDIYAWLKSRPGPTDLKNVPTFAK